MVTYRINRVLPTVVIYKGTSLIPRDDMNFVRHGIVILLLLATCIPMLYAHAEVRSMYLDVSAQCLHA